MLAGYRADRALLAKSTRRFELTGVSLNKEGPDLYCIFDLARLVAVTVDVPCGAKSTK